MMRWVQAIWHRFEKIIRYLFCSIISTVFDVAIVWCLYHLAGVSLVVANTVGVVAGFLISYVLSARQVFETRYDAASFAIFFATFLMGLVCADGLKGLEDVISADGLILWTEHLVSPFLPKGWAFLVSKGVSIVGPFFLMYFVRKYAFQKLESKRKGS